jgi:TonB-dependent Receptor Plug Domain
MSLGVHLLNQAAIIMRPSRLVSVIAAAAALLPAERGAAQDSGVPAASAQPAQGLEEVIVTAQKRPENIQTVPVSIVAFSAEGLRQLGMMEGFDLANQVPNMNIDAPVADSNVRYFICRVGTQDFNTLATSPIALYIDDVYLGSTIANSVNFYDLQRVEVLLGPQGTLWGKNTTGGAINFIGAHPTQTLAASGSGGYGNHGERFAEGMVNVPLTAILARGKGREPRPKPLPLRAFMAPAAPLGSRQMAAADAVQRPAPRAATYAQRSRGQLDLSPISASRAHLLDRLCAPFCVPASARSDTIDCGKPASEEICHGKLFQQLLD